MTYVEEIGATSGKVWGFLAASGPVSLSALENGVDAPRSLVYMALGWLAREGKVAIERRERTIQVRLT